MQRVAPGLRGLLDMRGGGGEIGGKKIGERRIVERGRVLRRQFQRRGIERSNVFGDDAGFGPARVGQIDERRRDAGEILDHARESGRRAASKSPACASKTPSNCRPKIDNSPVRRACAIVSRAAS